MIILKNKYFWIILLMVAIVSIVLNSLPKPIDTNLEKIGNGQNSVVFVYDLNLAVSNQQATEINKAREQIGDQATFLILKAGNPKTADFRKHHNANPPELLFFNRNGTLIDRKLAVMSAAELIEALSVR